MLFKISSVILLLILTVGLSSADSVISPTGSSDQNIINKALESGGTVHLNSGVYVIDGPIFIGSNTRLEGDKDAIIRVSPSSSQYFIGMTGIISSNGPVDNVEISGFQIDGNCDELPSSYANSAPQYDHDAERAIIINGYTEQFCNNIIVRNMQIYDCFSDGIHIRMANNAKCYDNFLSNCQHEGIFFTSIVNGEIFNNKIAGITSDCLRVDNCVYNKVYKNILYSYTGGNSNGEYQGGQNGLQVANAGSSHGYDASNKPTTTTQVEVFDNVFANGMLNTVWVHSVDQNQVYVHDNKLMSGEELETMGIVQSNVSYINPPTKEMSEKIFSSIFDVLDLTFKDTGRTNQTEAQINYTVIETPNGKISGGIKIVGFKDMIKINDTSYIPDSNSTLIKYSAVKAPGLNLSGSQPTLSKEVNVKIENGTAYATLNVIMKWKKIKISKSTGKTTKRTYTETATFTDSCPAPNVLIRPKEVRGIIYQYPTFFRVVVPSESLVNVKYTYDGNTSQHNYLVGTRNHTETGVEYTEYTKMDYWEGALQHENNIIYVLGEFDRSKLKVIASTPYEDIEVTEFDIIKKDYPQEIISKWFYIEVFFFAWAFVFLWWLKKQIF